MATEASIASLEADQKKLAERIERFEQIMKKIYSAFVLLFGENVPYELKKVGDEWNAIVSAETSAKAEKVFVVIGTIGECRIMTKTIFQNPVKKKGEKPKPQIPLGSPFSAGESPERSTTSQSPKTSGDGERKTKKDRKKVGGTQLTIQQAYKVISGMKKIVRSCFTK